MRPWVIAVLSTIYVIIGVSFFAPLIMPKRVKYCSLVPTAFNSGRMTSRVLRRVCDTIKWEEPSMDDVLHEPFPRQMSTLGFNFSRYYAPMSTGPRILEKPKTQWITGPETFVSFMNLNYLPRFEKEMAVTQSQFIYQKAGSGGIANQMYGVCDSLLLGILNDRLFQVNAPGIPNHFFDFPIFNLTFPATLPVDSEIFRYSHTVDVGNSSVQTVVYSHRQTIGGINSSPRLNEAFPNRFVLNASTSMLKPLTNQARFREFVISLNATTTLTSKSWYPICLRSVFQPSAFMRTYLDPFLEVFRSHFMIGLHCRMSGEISVLDESSSSTSHLTLSQVEGKREEIAKLMNENSTALIFLSTDSRLVEAEIARWFPGKVKTSGELPRMHTGVRTTEAGLMRAYLDVQLLASCDILFLTQKSGISRLSKLMNMKVPNITFF